MYIEIKIALNFFLSYLYDKLPRRRVNLFGEELEKYIGQKLTLANWPVTNQSNSSHTSTPPPPTTSLNESHAITLNKQELYVDSFVISAATESALDLKEIVAQMPDYLKLFIEPGLVAYLLEPPNAESTIASQLPDLKILYKLPQIDLSTLTYISGNFKESAIYQNSVTHIPEDSASTSGDLTATNSILNENLLQLLSAAATAANATTSSSPNSGVSAAPLQYFMQKLSLNEEQTSQVLSNLGQLSKQQQQQPPKVTNHGLGFPSAQFKPTLSPTDPIIQADYGSFNNRNAISPTGGTELWSSSSSSCSSSSSSTGGSSSCLSMQQPPAPSSLPTSSSSPSSKSLINNLDNTASPSLLLAAVDGSVKKPPTAMSSQPANIPVMKPPSSLFTTAEFAQTKFGSTKSKNSYYAPNKPGKSSSTAPQPHNPNHSQSSPITPQPLLSPQNSHSFHNPYHHAHHQQQKMNPEFSAYIKQKAAVQQLLKSSSVHPILGSPTSTLPTSQQPHLNGIMKPPQLSSHLSADAYLDLNLITNHLNSTNLIYDMDNSSNTSSSCSSSSTGSLTSPQHTQQQNHQAQQHQLNLLLMNLLKANSSGFDYLNSSPLFAATSSAAAAAAACNFNDHHTNFDSIVNSTIKEMIDGDLDEFDETTTEETNNKLPITNSEFDENNNNNLAANLIDDE